MKKLYFILLIALSFNSFGGTGTLFLAHGSMNGCGYENPSEWEQYVLEVVSKGEHSSSKNVQVAFGVWRTKCSDLRLKKGK